MILSSTELSVPSDRKETASLPKPPPNDTFLKYLQTKEEFLTLTLVSLPKALIQICYVLVEGLSQVPAGLLLLPACSEDLAAAPPNVATQVGNEVVGILVALVTDERLDSLGEHFHGDRDLNRRTGRKNLI